MLGVVQRRVLERHLQEQTQAVQKGEVRAASRPSLPLPFAAFRPLPRRQQVPCRNSYLRLLPVPQVAEAAGWPSVYERVVEVRHAPRVAMQYRACVHRNVRYAENRLP